MTDTPAVSTVQVIDPRIEPQPEPVYANTIGPDQNQFYTINASGLSDSYITFNNLTTLGKDRAYLDTFELEITASITFRGTHGTYVPPMHTFFMPKSFPFNRVCDQIRVNINGGAFFNSPLASISAKERYWDDKKLMRSFANHTPCIKPYLQDEMCYHNACADDLYNGHIRCNRTRMFGGNEGYGCTPDGPTGANNFSILPNYHSTFVSGDDEQTVTIDKVTWREPIFCSPFSSRYDATYGRPLYNITSIDLAFNLTDLRNMFLFVEHNLTDFEVHITDCKLCYQVLTVTAPISHSFTVVPYRRYVPYITDFTEHDIPGNTVDDISMTSGVYTLNEVPTAIWIFAAPCLREYQEFNYQPRATLAAGETAFYETDTSRNTNNKLFGFMSKISISCGNTTQILNTATPYDLYRIAKANGCQDSFIDWSNHEPFYDHVRFEEKIEVTVGEDDEATDGTGGFTREYYVKSAPGCGSVLRLIPGTDIVLPEQKLVPGANANNLVFQVQADFTINNELNRACRYALWILFEYVGVASITPGNCVVTMNPLGNGAIMAAAPTISGTNSESEATPSTTEGSGWLDKIRSALGVANKIAKDTKIISSALKFIPGVGEIASNIASQFGYGYKRPRIPDDGSLGDGGMSGGAVMGLGDFC